MSEEGYIKVACHECSERISLPIDGVGVAFNCPHCGVDLQMLLKHTCEHCGGRLSFEGKPEAIGVQIECGHCHQATALQPSTFAVDNAEAITKPATEEEYDEEEYEEEEYEEEEYEEEEYEEEEYEEDEEADDEEDDEEDVPEADVETRRRKGPPKPRPPGRRGLPKPRPPKRAGGGASAQDTPKPGQQSEKIGRRLAGAGAKPKEEDPSGGSRKRPRPKRKTRPQRTTGQSDPEAQPSSGPPSPGIPSRRIAGTTPESQDVDPMDPMGGVVPGGSPSVAGPAGPGPVQRKVAGAGQAGATPQPSFKVIDKKADYDDDDEDGPWYKNKEKKKLAVVVGIFVFVFIELALPTAAGFIFDFKMEHKVKRIVRLQFLFGGGGYRDNRTKAIEVDTASMKIQRGSGEGAIFYVTGDVKNTSSDTFQQVELKFHLFDSAGTKLGETVEYKDEVGPNSTWNFRAACMFTNVARADLVEVIVR